MEPFGTAFDALDRMGAVQEPGKRGIRTVVGDLTASGPAGTDETVDHDLG